jgi:phosphoadenosine phosphosulfate reductase
MFPEESHLLNKVLGQKLLPAGGWQDGLWMRQKTIWCKGARLCRLSANGKPVIIRKYFQNLALSEPKRHCTPTMLRQANATTLRRLEKEAVRFIQKVTKKYLKRLPVVSFSGGKDSTVVSHLVRKALRGKKIPHVFGDTTLEFPDTYGYVRRFRGKNPCIPFYTSKSNKDFYEMCDLLEPPTMINKWCCSVFKKAPISKIMNRIKTPAGVISFEGIRRSESNKRRKYDRLYRKGTIAHQLSAQPIIRWKDVEVWLYILANRLDFNDAYRKGFSRVGCLYCPNSSPYTDYLLEHYYAESRRWMEYITRYAESVGKVSPSEYAYSGSWKKRIGPAKPGHEVFLASSPCANEECAERYFLLRPYSDALEQFIKPLGRIIKVEANSQIQYHVKDPHTNASLFYVHKVVGSRFQVRVVFLIRTGAYSLRQKVMRQLKKFQSCVGCGACESVCPSRAIRVASPLNINERLCTHCGRCIDPKIIPSSCVAVEARRKRR